MTNYKKFLFLLIIFWIVVGVGAEVIPVSKMAVIEKQIINLYQKYGDHRVLVVFDIDNTLLAMNQDLGSDQWYDWQSTKLKTFEGKSTLFFTPPPLLFAPNTVSLLKIQGLLFSLSRMSPPEGAETVRIIKTLLADKRHNLLLLTSRGPGDAVYTIRELLRNGMNFYNNAIKPSDPFMKFWSPYQPDSVAGKYGFTQQECREFKLFSPARMVYFSDGIFFTAGQHKGVMLRIILAKTGLKPACIVFSDDKLKHSQRVEAAFTGSGTRIVSFWYRGHDKVVNRFHNSLERKKKTYRQWQALTAAYLSGDSHKVHCLEREIFPERRQ